MVGQKLLANSKRTSYRTHHNDTIIISVGLFFVHTQKSFQYPQYCLHTGSIVIDFVQGHLGTIHYRAILISAPPQIPFLLIAPTRVCGPLFSSHHVDGRIVPRPPDPVVVAAAGLSSSDSLNRAATSSANRTPRRIDIIVVLVGRFCHRPHPGAAAAGDRGVLRAAGL
jgi:hypothetical protein